MSQARHILGRTMSRTLSRLQAAHRAFGGTLGERPQAGFTLIEVMLAVTILASLTAITWVGVSSMFDTRDWMTERFERYQIMRVSMDRMARELASSYLAGPEHGGEPIPGQQEQAQRAAGAQEEDAASANMQALMEPVQFGMIGRDDELDFTAFAHVRSIAGEKASQHAEIGYFTERNRDPDTGELVTSLMRREDTSLDDDITDGGTIYTMIPSIESVQFEYWDPGPVKVGTMEEMAEGRWQDSWDTTKSEFAGRLPTRVRITVTLPPQEERGEEEIFVIQTQIATTEVLEF